MSSGGAGSGGSQVPGPGTDVAPLPPGWDTKFDPRTGRYYFINHYTKSTSWEDPRVRYQQIGKPTASASKENKIPTTSQSTTKPTATTSAGISSSSVAAAGDASSSSDLLKDSTASSSQVVTSAAAEAMPLQCYPIGMIPVSSHTQPVQLSDSEAAAATATLQDVSNRKSAGSPITGRASVNTPQPFVGSSGGAGTGVQASPLPLQRLQLEESYNGSPMSQRSTLRRESHVLADISEVESTCGTVAAAASTEQQSLQNVAAMFPTVDEAQIRELLKKYHGSQAVVISALQVAKHPFITPGPSTVFTPPPTRHSTLPGVSQGVLAGIAMTGSLPHYYNNNNNNSHTGPNMTPIMGLREAPSMCSSGYPTPRPGSSASGFDNSFSMGSPQIGQVGTLFRSFPRPHSSPKMKLRYLKSVFPTVEEYLLLDVLSNSENNVQKAADKLVKMGYVKRDTPSAPRLHARRKEEERLAEKRTPLPKPPPIKSDKEKEDLRRKMRSKYEVKFDIPERILYMALESVLYDEEQANNLITAMIEDDLKRKKAKDSEKAKAKAKEKEKKKSPKPVRKAMEDLRLPRHPSPKHEPKKMSHIGHHHHFHHGQQHGKKGWSSSKTNISVRDDIDTMTRGTCTQEDSPGVKANGPNPALRKGPNDDLLLTDYVTWNGPDPDLRRSGKSCAKGPNPLLGHGNRYLARGPNRSLCKGPNGLAKGSIYSQLAGGGGVAEINAGCRGK